MSGGRDSNDQCKAAVKEDEIRTLQITFGFWAEFCDYWGDRREQQHERLAD
jgi:hypothetical protein